MCFGVFCVCLYLITEFITLPQIINPNIHMHFERWGLGQNVMLKFRGLYFGIVTNPACPEYIEMGWSLQLYFLFF